MHSYAHCVVLITNGIRTVLCTLCITNGSMEKPLVGSQQSPRRWYKNTFTNLVLLESCSPWRTWLHESLRFVTMISSLKRSETEPKKQINYSPAKISFDFFSIWFFVDFVSEFFHDFQWFSHYFSFKVDISKLHHRIGAVSSGALQPTIGAKPPFSDIALELDDQRIYAQGNPFFEGTINGFWGSNRQKKTFQHLKIQLSCNNWVYKFQDLPQLSQRQKLGKNEFLLLVPFS